MKKLLLILYFISFNSYALEIGMEHGKTTSFASTPRYYAHAKYSAVSIRYGKKIFTEGIFGNWYGESHGEFYGGAIGYRSQKPYFTEGTFGLVKVYNFKSDNLDGNYQFTYTLGIGRKFDNLSVMVKFRHLSNGNTQGRNNGQDFIGIVGAIKI